LFFSFEKTCQSTTLIRSLAQLDDENWTKLSLPVVGTLLGAAEAQRFPPLVPSRRRR
jgi:hypothetical protein